MKQGKEMIESCKFARIEMNLMKLRKVLDAVLSAHYSLNERLDALHNVQPIVLNLVRDTNEVCGEMDLELLDKSQRISICGLLNDAVSAVESYKRAKKETKMLIELPNIGKMPPLKAGRPKASTDKHLRDFLKDCDSSKVIQTIKEDPGRVRAGYFGQMLIALLDLGYIGLSDIGKELYEAVKKDFPEAPSISSIRKICPQNKGLIDEYKNMHKHKIESIKKILSLLIILYECR